MYPASTILRLFYNNTADVTHDTVDVGWGQRLSDGRSRIFLSPARPIPFTTRTKHSSVWSAAAPAPRCRWVFIEVDGARRCHHSRQESWRGCHAGHMAAWQHGSRALHYMSACHEKVPSRWRARARWAPTVSCSSGAHTAACRWNKISCSTAAAPPVDKSTVPTQLRRNEPDILKTWYVDIVTRWWASTRTTLLRKQRGTCSQ